MSKKTYVVGFLFTEDPATRKVVLIEKQRPDWQRGRFNGPGGRVQEGETPAAAMRREYVEECGVNVDSWHMVCELHAGESVIYFFRAFDDRAFRLASAMTDELISAHPVDALPITTIQNLRFLIPMALYANTLDFPYTLMESTCLTLKEFWTEKEGRRS